MSYWNDPSYLSKEVEVAITFGVNNPNPRKGFHEEPNVVFIYCGTDPKVEDGEWEDEDGNSIEPTDEMIKYIRQQLWIDKVHQEPRSVFIDGVFVIYIVEVVKGVCRWDFHAVSETDWCDNDYEPTVDLSTLTQDQMREILLKADQQIGDKFIAYYPQWNDYKHIDLVDTEIY